VFRVNLSICDKSHRFPSVPRCIIDREIATQIDRHSGAINKERQRLFAAHTQLMSVFAKLGVSAADARVVIEKLRPYWARIAEQLRESGAESTVNSERDVATVIVHNPASKAPTGVGVEEEKPTCN
jgi:hypothetical protein